MIIQGVLYSVLMRRNKWDHLLNNCFVLFFLMNHYNAGQAKKWTKSTLTHKSHAQNMKYREHR